MKVTYHAEDGTWPAQQHIVEALRAAGHHVDVEARGGYGRYVDPEYIAQHNQQNYDVSIFTIHAGNPQVTKFIVNLKTKFKYIYEHDVFGNIPEGTSPAYNLTRYICFTKQHQAAALEHGTPNVTPARWYKLDMDLPEAEAHPSLYRNAVLIESVFFDKAAPFPYSSLFDQTYYKRWADTPHVQPGCTSAPPELVGMAGYYYSSMLGKFWFTRESSMYTEALMCDCIPILYGAPKTEFLGADYIASEDKVDDIISDVLILRRISDKHVAPFRIKRAVTCTNLAPKIAALQADRGEFDRVLKELQKECLFDEPVPTVESIILADISQ